MLRRAFPRSLGIAAIALVACATPLPAPEAKEPPAAPSPCSPCPTASVADGSWRCEINSGTKVTVGAGSIRFANGIGQNGSGCISCDGAYEAVSDRGDWSNVNGRFLATGDSATLAWQWCLAPLDACRVSGGNIAGPVPCVRTEARSPPPAPAARVIIPAPPPAGAPNVAPPRAPAPAAPTQSAPPDLAPAAFDLSTLPPLMPTTLEKIAAASECRREGGYSSPMGESDINFEVFVFGPQQQLIRVEDVGGAVCVLHGMRAPGCKPGAKEPPVHLQYGGTRLGEVAGAPDTARLQLRYDAQGRLGAVASVRNENGKPSTSMEYFRYGADGQVEAWARDDNGDGRVDGTRTWDLDVDAQGRATRFHTQGQGQEHSSTYAYDSEGRLHTVAHQLTKPDARGKPVIAQQTTTYTYDARGNLLSEATCSSPDNCLELSFRYRADGTLESASETLRSGMSSEDSWYARYSAGCLLKVSPPAPTQVYRLGNDVVAGEDEVAASLARISVVAKAGPKVSRENREVLR